MRSKCCASILDAQNKGPARAKLRGLIQLGAIKQSTQIQSSLTLSKLLSPPFCFDFTDSALRESGGAGCLLIAAALTQ